MTTLALSSGIAALASATAAAGTAPDEAPAALLGPIPLPTPSAFVSGLDLECYDTPGPDLGFQLSMSHLSPVLQALGLPAHGVVMRELQQTCVPVMKDGVSPPAAALLYIQHVDLACYRIEAPAPPGPPTLQLRHLNPVFAALPKHYVMMLAPTQLCVPVGKNGATPPPELDHLVRYIDLACYQVNATEHPTFDVGLTQLNPQLATIPAHGMSLVSTNRQLCVPVRKSNQAIPAGALAIVRWLSLEKFQAATPVDIPPRQVVLRHLNPLLEALPSTSVMLRRANALMVPVAKNNQLPSP